MKTTKITTAANIESNSIEEFEEAWRVFISLLSAHADQLNSKKISFLMRVQRNF